MQQTRLGSIKSKYELTLLAKIAQQTQRYDQMVIYANKLLLLDEELTNSERNLCTSAYKNVISNRRAQLKVLQAIGNKLTDKDNRTMYKALQTYRQDIQNQLKKTCLNIIKLIEEKVIPGKVQIKTVEAKIFYLKMRADFYRYLCEIDLEDDSYFNLASQCYEEADALARSNLPPTNQVRISLHLNMSVFLYERCGEIEKALELANRAFDQAVANVNQTNEESFKNCTVILQLLRDNISLWSGEVDE